MSQPAPSQLEYTGERMVPEAVGDADFWDHVERYRFAANLVRGRDVLDIACGEGYGTAALKLAGAGSIIGIDISPDAVAHAQQRYGVDARIGSADAIPLTNACVDVIVSYETVEHVPSPQNFISECVRVLRPGGSLIISTPNKLIYAGEQDANPFHCSEMSFEEFDVLLKAHFNNREYYGQQTPPPFYARRRGLRKLWRLARSIMEPPYATQLTSNTRSAIVDLASKPSAWPRIWSAPSVRKVSIEKLQRSRYMLAVASMADHPATRASDSSPISV